METKFRAYLNHLTISQQTELNRILYQYYDFLCNVDYKNSENLYENLSNKINELCDSGKFSKSYYFKLIMEIVCQIYRDAHLVFFPARDFKNPSNVIIKETFINVTNMLISIYKCNFNFSDEL